MPLRRKPRTCNKPSRPILCSCVTFEVPVICSLVKCGPNHFRLKHRILLDSELAIYVLEIFAQFLAAGVFRTPIPILVNFWQRVGVDGILAVDAGAGVAETSES